MFDGTKIAARALQRAEEIKYQKRSRNNKIKTATTLCLCVLCVGIFTNFLSNGAAATDEYFVLVDSPVPLAGLRVTEIGAGGALLTIPVIESITIPADRTDVSFNVTNPQENNNYLVFVIALDETGKVIYESEKIAPGASLGIIELLNPLREGVHTATLNIKTYSLQHETQGNYNAAIQIIAK